MTNKGFSRRIFLRTLFCVSSRLRSQGMPSSGSTVVRSKARPGVSLWLLMCLSISVTLGGE